MFQGCGFAATGRAGSSEACVVPSRVLFGAPTAGRRVGAFESVMAEPVAVVALGSGTKAEATLKAQCRAKG